MNLTTEPYILLDRTNNDSHYVCNQCDLILPIDLEQEISDGEDVYCPHCGTVQSTLDAGLILDERYAFIHENVDAVKDMRWYHISEIDEEFMEFSSENTMHIGQLDSLRSLVRQRTVWNTGWELFYIYELKIYPHTVIGKNIIGDSNYWEYVEDDMYYGHAQGYVYANRYESPGSVSVLIKRNCVEMVQCWENVFPNIS